MAPKLPCALVDDDHPVARTNRAPGNSASNPIRVTPEIQAFPARLAAVLALSFLVAWPAAIAAADDGIWPVQGRLLSNDGDKSEDISGIACTGSKFPRACLVIDDNRQAAQFVTVDDGEITAGVSVPLVGNMLDGKALDLDGEGVAYANGSFYVMGSHGHPRDRERRLDKVADADRIKAIIAANSQVVRIILKPGANVPLGSDDIASTQRSSKLREAIAADPTLSRFLDRRLENNGLTIEGVAVIGNRLFAGFRGPSLYSGQAPLLSVALDFLFGDGTMQAKLNLLPIGEGRGVRDLAVFRGGLLVLAGPTGDEDGAYSVYWWDVAGERLQFLADITKATDTGRKRKPEAILPLDEGPSGLRVLVLFDGSKEGGPQAIVIPMP
jgi:Protein of unknown function (DUF3616)